jgi:hypothetical protein
MNLDEMVPKTPSSQEIGPRFCPDCGYEPGRAEERPLCARCGTALALQGYCPICESRWRLAVGEMCPKHEVELIADEPVGGIAAAPGTPIRWVTVTRFPHTLAAAGARIRLEAEGIPTFLEGERMGSPSMYRVATGGVKLQVPAEMAADARIILSQNWSWPLEEGDEDLEEIGEEPAPDPAGSMTGWAIEAIIILILASPALIWLLVKLLGSHD